MTTFATYPINMKRHGRNIINISCAIILFTREIRRVDIVEIFLPHEKYLTQSNLYDTSIKEICRILKIQMITLLIFRYDILLLSNKFTPKGQNIQYHIFTLREKGYT